MRSAFWGGLKVENNPPEGGDHLGLEEKLR
ncbi:hypothetical protein HNQ76_002100 [Thermosulfuriphilus ammonigenes]|nr:hypothetical protein [Thermosulfuriphilus ammonigenes]